MLEIKKKLELPKFKYYETHFSLISCILPVKMTPTEIKVLASFMSLEGEIAEFSRFGASAKKLIRGQLHLSPGGLSNYMTSLTDKGVLRKIGDSLNILPILLPEQKEQLYMFKLVNIYSNGKDH